MSIVVSMRVPTGVALAADSVACHEDGLKSEECGEVMQTFEHESKLFQLGKAPIGIQHTGYSLVNNVNTERLLHVFASNEFQEGEPPEHYRIEEITKRLRDFLLEQHKEHYSKSGHRAEAEFTVSGFPADRLCPRGYRFSFPEDPLEIEELETYGADWSGFSEPIEMLLKGISPRAWGYMKEEADLEVPEDVREFVASEAGYDYAKAMPLQDAVNFAKFLVNLVKGSSEFFNYMPSIGGKVELAAISPGEFNWIERKSLDSGGDVLD